MAAPEPPPLSHAHHTAPPHIRAIHKTYQKLPVPALAHDRHILDLAAAAADTPARQWHAPHLKLVGYVPGERARGAFSAFRGAAGCGDDDEEEAAGGGGRGGAAIYEHDFVPGLQIIPSLLPPRTQRTLLSALLHKHLSNPEHATNLHPHYTLPYPSSPSSSDIKTASSVGGSFFTLPPTTPLPPLSPTHTPLTTHRMLSKKLRWLTLGAQYDWTLKQYPAGSSSVSFPADVGGLITDLLPKTTTPQAAITNLYSPGDTLAPHRDVSEASRAPLVSVSVGCDAVFVIGLDPATDSPPVPSSPDSPDSSAPPPRNPDADSSAEAGERVLVLRVHSGDVVVMGGASRWAWHSVPRVVAGSCPGYVAGWPGAGMGEWAGWMGGKRVNLNVRQMWD
ncbi:uncharacterized protein LAJ45_01754 [Morchella importuna]|uniref:uncharacterized protein n=1 Tax=Morchella importuna TaxID=1174673 RepID=UPI001E8E565C|nr:uncharacterized protein LAJ45_01754 [Morchella importuna]KAH8153987.1 hypothetical protein LAJ45_01754 [Morchella importuna]